MVPKNDELTLVGNNNYRYSLTAKVNLSKQYAEGGAHNHCVCVTYPNCLTHSSIEYATKFIFKWKYLQVWNMQQNIFSSGKTSKYMYAFS